MKSGFMKIDLFSFSFSAAALFNTPDIFYTNCSRTNVNDLYKSRYEKSRLIFLIYRFTLYYRTKFQHQNKTSIIF
jgi:hypothetical protein